MYSNIFEYFQLNIFISKYIRSVSVSRIYSDIHSYNVLPPEYIWIFIRTILSQPKNIQIFIRTVFSIPNIFRYSFVPQKNYSAFTDLNVYFGMTRKPIRIILIILCYLVFYLLLSVFQSLSILSMGCRD